MDRTPLVDRLLERNVLPDAVLRAGIRRLLRQRLRELAAGDAEAEQHRFMQFVDDLRTGPIAVHTDDANRQHYEVATRFYQLVLGPRLKYSAAYWPTGVDDLQGAEEAMLALSADRARLEDGQRVLDLGCGWGSFTLWLAERHRRSRITSVTNSATQKRHIEAECRRRSLDNVDVHVVDINDFDPSERFDRVVSVEMFEHLRNYAALFERVQRWLEPGGSLFIHHFAHARHGYPYEARGPSDWMARHFFTGGIMPSHHLLLYFRSGLDVGGHWTVDGGHYSRTLEGWLANMDRHRDEVERVFGETYGPENVRRWWVRWRIFFLACSELFRFRGGREWFVTHWRFEKQASGVSAQASGPSSPADA